MGKDSSGEGRVVEERSMGSFQLENLWHKLCPKCSLEIPGRTWLRLLCLPGKAALLHTETGQFRKALDAGAFLGFYPLGSTSFISPCCSLSPDCSPELFLILPSPFCSPRWTVGLPCLPQMKQPWPFQSFPKGCVCSPLRQRFQPSAAALAQFVSFVGEKDKNPSNHTARKAQRTVWGVETPRDCACTGTSSRAPAFPQSPPRTSSAASSG